MHKRLKQILLIVSLAVAFTVPSVSVKADDYVDANHDSPLTLYNTDSIGLNTDGNYIRSDGSRAWGDLAGDGLWHANPNTVAIFNSYDKQYLGHQWCNYGYFMTSGSHTRSGSVYHTIGARASYIAPNEYCYFSDNIGDGYNDPACQAFWPHINEHGNYVETDIVMHRVNLVAMLNQLPTAVKDLKDWDYITVTLGSVFDRIDNSSSSGYIYNYKGRTGGTAENDGEARNLFWDFDGGSLNEMSNSFQRKLTLSTPPVFIGTQPVNKGITKAVGNETTSTPLGDFSILSYRNKDDSNSDLSRIWVKNDGATHGDISLTTTGQQDQVADANWQDENSIRSISTSLSDASTNGYLNYETFYDGSNRADFPTEMQNTTYLFNNTDCNANNLLFGMAKSDSNATGLNGWQLSGQKQVGASTTNWKLANGGININPLDAYTVTMQTISKNNSRAPWSDSLSTIYTDDNGPTWTDPKIDAKGYSSSPTIEFADVQDAKAYGGNDGVGLAGMTYKMYSNDTEKSKATENILFKMVKPTAGSPDAYVDSSTEAINSSGLDPAYTGSSVLVDFSKFKDKNITLEVTAYDWLGNKTTRTYTIVKSNPEVTSTVNLNKTWKYSEPNSKVKWFSELDNPTLTVNAKVDSNFGVIPDTNDLKLTNEEDSSKVYEDLGDASTDSPKTKNFFSTANYSGSAYSSDDKSTNFLASVFKYSPADNLDNTRWNPSALSKVTYNGNRYASPEVGEADGLIVGLDEKAPVNFSADWCASDKITFTAEDQASGLDRVDLVTNGKVVQSIKLSNDSTKVTRVVTSDYTLTLDSESALFSSLVVYDNVGHSKEISVPDAPKIYTDLTADSVQNSAGKYVLRVNAKGYGENPVYGDINNFKFNFQGTGHKVDGQSSDSVTNDYKGSMVYTVDVPDDLNTTNAPIASIDSADHPTTLSWTSLDDVMMPYNFKVYGSSSGFPEDAQQAIKTVSNKSDNPTSEDFSTSIVNSLDNLNKPFKFCSGFGSYQIAVYYEGGTQDPSISTSYSSKKMVSGDSPYQSTNPNLNVSNLSEGWYYARVWMIDRNGNPSGIGTIEWHQPPTFVAQIGLKVTAVKDVNWEKENYPFVYTEAGKSTGGPVTITKGKDYDKFSLGSNYKPSADKDAVHNGYIVNYRINRDVTNVKSVNIKYEFTDSSGNPLTMLFADSSGNLKPLEQYDSSEHTNYVSQIIDSPSDLAQMTPGSDGLLLKHQVPSGSRAIVQGTNSNYNGDVLVTAVFTVTSTDGVTSPAGTEVKVPLYTMSMQTSAEDDVTLNPVR